jgi:hypothetical protein
MMYDARTGKRIPAERYVMQEHLNRVLDRSETVVFKDGDANNLALENLELVLLSEIARNRVVERRRSAKAPPVDESKTGVNGCAGAKVFPKEYDRQAILRALSVFAIRHGRLPTSSEAQAGSRRLWGVPPYSSVLRELGAAGWQRAMQVAAEAIGLPQPLRSDHGWNEGAVLGLLHRYYREFGSFPSTKEIEPAERADGMPAGSTIKRVLRAETWEEAVRYAAEKLGVEPKLPPSFRSKHSHNAEGDRSSATEVSGAPWSSSLRHVLGAT